MKNALAPIPVPTDLSETARIFVDLQKERHQADYDLGRNFLRQDALQCFDKAERAIKTLWPSIKDEPATRFFLVSLLTWKNLKR